MSGITAIVPTFNRPDMLRDCIASLLAQTRPLTEILVVDDGSDVDVGPALQGFDGPIRLLRQPNSGKPAALNLGLSHARGDYIWICDDDDLALPDAAAKLAAALDGSDAGFAYGGFLRFRDDPTTGKRTVYGPGYWPQDADRRELFATLLDDFFIFQFGTLVRRSAYERVGAFREDLTRSQDYDMILRLARYYSGCEVEGPVFLQREHDAARGSKADRFDAGQAFDKWIEYDQRLFTDLHRQLPLEAFAPAELKSASPWIRKRAAHLKRGCVLARRKLWSLALGDLKHANALCNAGPATEAEMSIASGILGGKYGCQELLSDRGLLQDLADAFRLQPYGRSLSSEVARPLRWRAREAILKARPKEGLCYLLALFRFMGPLRAVSSLLSGAWGKLARWPRQAAAWST